MAARLTPLSDDDVSDDDVSDDDVSAPDAVELPITGELDLHAFAPRDVPGVVEDYLAACRERGILEVRVVHGRGRGVQRAVVRRLLARLAFVRAFREAAPASGGWGATLVELQSPADAD